MGDFHLYRAVEGQRKKDGVTLFLRTDIAAETTELLIGSDGYFKHIMMHMMKDNLVVENVYNPPGTDTS